MRKLWIIVGFLVVMVFAAGENKKNILVIESYSGDYQWDESYKEGLESVLGKTATITYFEMNTKKLPKSEHQKMADLAWAKYQTLAPDLVILGDDAALKFLGEKFAATKTPVVYLGINNNPRNYFKELPSNITGVLERPILKRGIDYIKEIYPKAKKGLILFDTDITAAIVKKEVFYDRDSIELGSVTADIRLIDTYANWKNSILTAGDKYDFIVLGLYSAIKDEKGNVLLSDEVAKWSSDNTKIPMFAFWDFNVGKDAAIGGLVLFGKDMGIEAGKIVNDIFAGKDIKKMNPVTNNQGIFLFSKSQVEKWKISLPAEIKSKAKFVE